VGRVAAHTATRRAAAAGRPARRGTARPGRPDDRV